MLSIPLQRIYQWRSAGKSGKGNVLEILLWHETEKALKFRDEIRELRQKEQNEQFHKEIIDAKREFLKHLLDRAKKGDEERTKAVVTDGAGNVIKTTVTATVKKALGSVAAAYHCLPLPPSQMIHHSQWGGDSHKVSPNTIVISSPRPDKMKSDEWEIRRKKKG